MGNLLGLLSGRSAQAAEIGGLVGLAHKSLKRLPSLANGGWGALVGNRGVDSSSEVADGALDKGALGVSRTEESQVDSEKDNAALRESENGDGQAEQQRHLEVRHKIHAGIVVLFHEAANSFRQGRLSNCRPGRTGRGGRSRSASGLRALEGRDQVSTSVGRNVEDGINAEWKQSERHLARVEPHQRSACGRCQLLKLSSPRVVFAPISISHLKEEK